MNLLICLIIPILTLDYKAWNELPRQAITVESMLNKMKKLLLIIAFITISKSIFCQNTEITYGAQVGTWSKVKQDFVWSDFQEVKLIITFNKSVVSISNELGSVIETLEVTDSNANSITWKALDEDYIPCYLVMETFDTYNVLGIVYSDLCFKYYY